MFPEEFVQRHLAWSKPGDLVLDPFCGRGTTVFESLLRGRKAIGCDTNQVAVCVSRAKADPPTLASVLERISELEELYEEAPTPPRRTTFFRWCFHQETYGQVVFLRDALLWKKRRDDCFIAAMSLGLLHGESHKTEWCFSNRMPRTISTKPDYSVRWWQERELEPPKRDVFRILREMAVYRFASAPATVRGHVQLCDVRKASRKFDEHTGKVKLVITSPPYLDTTDYREDQWLRLWFLGGDDAPPQGDRRGDDRHRAEEQYWQFLQEAWRGVGDLLADGAHVIVRIGGRRIVRDECERQLLRSMRAGFATKVTLVERQTSTIRKRQAIAFHPQPLSKAVEHDFHFRIS